MLSAKPEAAVSSILPSAKEGAGQRGLESGFLSEDILEWAVSKQILSGHRGCVAFFSKNVSSYQLVFRMLYQLNLYTMNISKDDGTCFIGWVVSRLCPIR